MTATHNTPDLLADMTRSIHELVNPHHHHERFQVRSPTGHRKVWQTHSTLQEPLLDQMADVIPAAGGNTHDSDSSPKRRSPPGSREPVHLDVIDRLQTIRRQVTQWRKTYSTVSVGSLASDICVLLGAATAGPRDQLHRLAGDVDRWHLWCLTLTGWRTPPWRPNVACPQCGRTPSDKAAGLRVRLDRQTAICLTPDCGATWRPDTIGLLAQHISSAQAGASSTGT